MSCHHTTSLQLKQRRKKFGRRDGTSTVNVCTIAVRRASARPRLRCDQRRPSSLALPQANGRCTKKRTLSMYQHFSSSSIAQPAVCHSCKVLQSTMKRTKESDMDGQAELFSFGFSRWRSGNQPQPNPSSSGSSEQIQKPSSSKESTSSPLEEEQRALEVNL